MWCLVHSVRYVVCDVQCMVGSVLSIRATSFGTHNLEKKSYKFFSFEKYKRSEMEVVK